MTDKQWNILLKTIKGENLDVLPVGFIIDCPWLPNWAGVNMLDYFSNDELWLSSNLKVQNKFPDIMFFPGFWSEYGMTTEPSAFGIDGIFLLDDIIGFVGEPEFLKFGFPYFKELYDFDVSVKFLHNDAKCEMSAPHLANMGVNLFNMGFDIDLNFLKELTKNQITFLGNIPPRDILANGTIDEIKKVTTELLDSFDDYSRVILSCGGGMPPDVSTENIRVFAETVRNYTR